MRPPYISVLVLIFATCLGSSGCTLMENFKNPNSLARRVGNFSPTKLDSDKAEMQAAKNVTPLIKGSRDLDGRQEQFDPAFGTPETQAELNQERADMNVARSAAATPNNGTLGAGSPSAGGGAGIYGSADATKVAPANSVSALSASGGAPFGKPGNGTSPIVAPSSGFAGKGSQFGSPNAASISSQITSINSSGKLNQTTAETRSSSSSLAKESKTKSATGLSTSVNSSSVAIVQTPDSSRFGLAHGDVRPTTFAPTRSNTPISDIPLSSTANNNQGFGCPPAGMVSLGGGASSGGNQNSFGTVASAPRSSFSISSPPTFSSPSSSPSFTPTAVPSVGSSQPSDLLPLKPVRTNADPVSATRSARSETSSSARLESSSEPVKSGWDFKAFRLPSFKFPFQFPSKSSKPEPSSQPSPVGNAGGSNDLEIVNAQNSHSQNAMVTITAVVKKLLPDDRDGSPHQRFLLGLSNGSTVLVAHNISLAPYVPLKEGDYVTISGEYIWNEKGGVLHYTHHTTNRKHRGGYIEYNHQTYQ